jgi:hypothetical protein
MTAALRHLIGKICHIYLNNIIIWLQTLEEHENNVQWVLEALHTTHLYCSVKKISLFNMEIDFLGHHISAQGIDADNSKIACILNWPRPHKAKHIQSFLGFVRYLTGHLPNVTKHTSPDTTDNKGS